MIWGGRDPRLRNAKTIATLQDLVHCEHLQQDSADQLTSAYWFLRRVEHRLQMIEDQQTHSLPNDDEGLAEIGAFMGYENAQAFAEELIAKLRCVEGHYARLFEDDATPKSDISLVVTDSDPNDEVLETLEKLGFSDGAQVFHLIRGWQSGRYRATRSPRAQRILGELLPSLLKALGETAQPDFALTKFDSFLAGLPGGRTALFHAQREPDTAQPDRGDHGGRAGAGGPTKPQQRPAGRGVDSGIFRAGRRRGRS